MVSKLEDVEAEAAEDDEGGMCLSLLYRFRQRSTISLSVSPVALEVREVEAGRREGCSGLFSRLIASVLVPWLP